MSEPSDLFLAAIVRAYDRAAVNARVVRPSDIWDYICIDSAPIHGRFIELFAWDPRQHVNRIGTIRECLAACQVPGLRLRQDAKGSVVVRV